MVGRARGDRLEAALEEFVAGIAAGKLPGIQSEGQVGDEVFAVLVVARVSLELEDLANGKAACGGGATHYFVSSLEFLEADPGVAFSVC